MVHPPTPILLPSSSSSPSSPSHPHPSLPHRDPRTNEMISTVHPGSIDPSSSSNHSSGLSPSSSEEDPLSLSHSSVTLRGSDRISTLPGTTTGGPAGIRAMAGKLSSSLASERTDRKRDSGGGGGAANEGVADKGLRGVKGAPWRFLAKSRDAVLGAVTDAAGSVFRAAQKVEEVAQSRLQTGVAAGDGSVWFGSRSGFVVQLDRNGGRVREVSFPSPVLSLCVTGLRLWVGTKDGMITILHVRSGQKLLSWAAHCPPENGHPGSSSSSSNGHSGSGSGGGGGSGSLGSALGRRKRGGAIRQLVRCGPFVVSLAQCGEVNAWLAALPGPADGVLKNALKGGLEGFTRRRRLRVAVGSWNVGEEKANIESVKAWLGQVASGADVVVVGLQEVTMHAGAIALATAKESVSGCLRGNHVVVHTGCEALS